MQSRLSIFGIFGLMFTGMALFMGAVVAKTAVLTCDRRIPPQGQCQVDHSTLLLPWVKTTTQIPLADVYEAEFVQSSERYEVILKPRQGEAIKVFGNSEGPGNFAETATSLNRYFNDPNRQRISVRSGDEPQSLAVLLGACGLGLGAAWFTRKRRFAELEPARPKADES
jgi:LPXTG-motif cell wall-anchored protein